MNILVIGGLGYVGSDLCDRLNKFCTVTILDPDLYQSAYVEQASGITIIPENLCSFDQGDSKYDHIVICSELDVEEFYESEQYRGYLFQYSKALKALAENNTEAQIIYLTSQSERKGTEHTKWSEQFMNHFSDHSKFIPIECPVLYGDNVVVRSDTFINEIVHNFLSYKSYMLNTNPFAMIKFLHIFKFTEAISELITSGEYEVNENCLHAVALMNTVQWSITGGDAYNISMAGDKAHTGEMESGYSSLDKPEEFKSQLNMMVNALNQGMTDELFKDHSNRSIVLQSALVGKRVNEKLTI